MVPGLLPGIGATSHTSSRFYRSPDVYEEHAAPATVRSSRLSPRRGVYRLSVYPMRPDAIAPPGASFPLPPIPRVDSGEPDLVALLTRLPIGFVLAAGMASELPAGGFHRLSVESAVWSLHAYSPPSEQYEEPVGPSEAPALVAARARAAREEAGHGG